MKQPGHYLQVAKRLWELLVVRHDNHDPMRWTVSGVVVRLLTKWYIYRQPSTTATLFLDLLNTFSKKHWELSRDVMRVSQTYYEDKPVKLRTFFLVPVREHISYFFLVDKRGVLLFENPVLEEVGRLDLNLTSKPIAWLHYGRLQPFVDVFINDTHCADFYFPSMYATISEDRVILNRLRCLQALRDD